MKCQECNENLLTNHADRDHGFIFCARCGLIFDPVHEMSYGISGLISWLRKYDVSKSDLQKITAIYVNNNLRDARLAAVPLAESYLVRKL